MVLLGIDLGTNEIRVQTGDSYDDIIKNQNIIKLENTISFHESLRKYGMNAKKCLYNDYGPNTFIYLKWLLCKTLSSDQVQSFIEQSLIHREQISTIKSDGEKVLFHTSEKIKYFNCVHKFYPIEIYAMILNNLKKQIISNLFLEDDEPLKCVISVPSYYTALERKCLFVCCQLANIECVSLVNDTTAICVYYAITKKNLLCSEPKLIIIIDCGETSLQICYAAVWDVGIKILHNYSINDFGGKRFDHKLYEKCCESESYKSIEKTIPGSILKAIIFRECEKAKISGFNSPFELRFNKDSSTVLFKEDFEQSCSDLFFAFAKYLRNSYDEFSKLYNLKNNDPSKTDAMSVLLCGATMKINKLKEIVNSVFRIDAKLFQKETVSKGCKIIGNIISNNKKKNFTIVDNITHDIQIIGSNTISTLVSRNTQLPSKFLVKNVEFSNSYKILINNEIEYGEFQIKLKNSKCKAPNMISWKTSINSQGIIEKLVPVCIKIDENNKEFIDNQYFTSEFQLSLVQDSIVTELKKKIKTFDRLESFQENGSKERLNLQNFIFQSIQFINELSVHLTNQKKIEILSMLEDEEKWLLDDESFSPSICLSKVELLKKRVDLIKIQKEIYDKCLKKLDEYKNKIVEYESMAKKYYIAYLNNNQKSIVLNDFEYKIFLRIVEDHLHFHKKYKENILDENILEIIISPEVIEEKINRFCKESNEIIEQSELNRVKVEVCGAGNNNVNSKDYCEDDSEEEYSAPKYNKLKRVRIKGSNDQSNNNHDSYVSDSEDSDYQTLNQIEKEATEIYDSLKPQNNELEIEIDPSTERKGLKWLPNNTMSLAVKGTEISKKILFSLRLANLKHIQFPDEWNVNIKMDRKEFKVEVGPEESEFELIKEKFQPMSDSKSYLIKAWRVQNENLWNNYFLRKSKIKPLNELELFYGCDGAYFKHICENNCQFRRSTWKCPDHGLGVYFYKNIADAHKNVKPYYRCYYMFICKVLVGKTILGTESTSKLPKGYHAGTNKKSLNSSSIFVIPKDASDQIYPFYLLAYEVKS